MGKGDVEISISEVFSVWYEVKMNKVGKNKSYIRELEGLRACALRHTDTVAVELLRYEVFYWLYILRIYIEKTREGKEKEKGRGERFPRKEKRGGHEEREREKESQAKINVRRYAIQSPGVRSPMKLPEYKSEGAILPPILEYFPILSP